MAAVLFLALLATTSAELNVDRAARWAECGVQGYPRQRIVNGQDAGECVWRWQVSINTEKYGQFCGGTLISPEWVLTAAHCVEEETTPCEVQSLKIGAGAHSIRLSELANDDHSVERRVLDVYLHPLYEKNVKHDYDFALLRLDKAVPLNRCIGAACLPSKKHVTGSNCTITGWGTLESSGYQPEFLQQAPVELVDQKSCEANYTRTKDIITSSMLCASGHSAKGITDTCQGDSGGPLVCQEDGRYVLHGVTSWGQGCALEGFAGVYSRVASSLSWIEDVMDGKTTADVTAQQDQEDVDFNGKMFAVTSGDCLVDEDGCVSSPGFASGATYSNGESCIIAVNTEVAKPLRVESFSTEAVYDKLMVNCLRYSGDTGPSGVVPTSTITWSTDASTVGQGWKLCPAS